MKMLKNSIFRSKALPRAGIFGPAALLIYDKRLSSKLGAWPRAFAACYAVKAGENLKAVENFPAHIKKILKLTEDFPRSQSQIVALGGGSVGDFAGFVANVLRRGVGLSHLPSTWLAAIDSAHGGKTALNVGGVKNQVGTFYPAGRVQLVDALLNEQNEVRADEALGELLKMAIVDGGRWSKDLAQDLSRGAKASALLSRFLMPAIQAKLKVVAKDPREITGHREILNLGHSVGHVFESYYGLAHGEAVALGLQFALEWSRHKKVLKVDKTLRALESALRVKRPAKKIPRKKFIDLLGRDKKRGLEKKIRFIFVEGLGRVYREAVSVEELGLEAQRQGWLRP